MSNIETCSSFLKKTFLFLVITTVFVFSIVTGCKMNSPQTALVTNGPVPIASYTELVSVPGGTFTQIDTIGNSFSHTISSFKIGKYQVTYDLWYKVYIWAVSNGYTFAYAGAEGNNGTIGAGPTSAKYQPVTKINWRDAIVWLNAYSQKTGLKPVYCSDAEFTTAIKSSVGGAYENTVNNTEGSFDNPYVNWTADGYRLPTEGEYQYAASYNDGTSWTLYSYASGAAMDYNDATETGLVGWYGANCSSTQAVGGKKANALGLYDMSGNVWHWCFDWYGIYQTGASENYTGPASGTGRVMRGGSYNNDANYLQVGVRYSHSPNSALTYYIGLRFVRAN